MSPNERPKPIILSLKDDNFKSIIYRHFRLLGTRRDRDKEVEAQKAIFAELTKDCVVGQQRHFYKLRDDRRISVTEQKAFEFIRETIQRRHSTTHLWLDKSINESKKKPQSAPIGRGELKSLQSPLLGDKHGGITSHSDEDETLASVAASKNLGSKRKSPRLKDEPKPTTSTSTTTISTKTTKTTTREQSPDILLSMLDPYYKQTIFHYFEQRKCDSTLNTVQATEEIYAKFQKYVKKSGGKYYKIGHKGGEQYVVGEDEVIRKIKTDLNKTNRYQNELASTVVLNVEWDTKYSRVMFKYYNSLAEDAPREQEVDAAEQAFNELRQKYIYFIQIVDGDRVEISQDDDLIVDIIFESIQKRNKTKSLWFGKGANEIMLSEPQRKRIKPTVDTITSQILPRERQQNSPPPEYNEQKMSSHPKSTSDIKSILDDRLPNRKLLTVTCRTPIETVAQLIQILQLATHKLNDLHGTQRRHCKVIRLHQLPEFGGDATGAPALSELAQYMSISQVNIRQWYEMCHFAENRGFDLRLLGDDRIDRHRGIFEEGEVDEELCVMEDSGERAIEEYLDQIVVDVLGRVDDGLSVKKTVKSSLDDLQESDDEMEVETGHTLGQSHELNGHGNAISTMNGVASSTIGLDPTLVDHELPFDDAMLSHRDSQPSEVRHDAKSDIAATHAAVAEESTRQTNGVTTVATTDSLLSKLRKGSRIIVKWGTDGALYRATVKKVRADSAEPSLKIHYDGKKSHIRDNISVDMIDSIIFDEETHEMSNKDVLARSDQSNIPIKDLLRGKYPNALPVGKLEHREQCSELGEGWTVYISSRRNQEGQKRLRADRYFISPSGKTCRSIKELEMYRLDHPEEFDLCSLEEESDDVVTEECATSSGEKNADSNPAEAKPPPMPQCQGPKELSSSTAAAAAAHNENEIHHFAADSFSPLMMGQPGPAIEDSHSDHEFLSSLMDEKGLLFGEEELEDDLTQLPSRDQAQPSQTTAATTDSIEACALKPKASCMKCPSPSPKGDGGADVVKKNVHFAEEPASQEDEAVEQDGEFKKKGLSPRMKQNKKELIGGIVPVFAMDVPAGAEFAGYLGDAHSDDSDSDSDSDTEGSGPPLAAASLSPVKVQESGAFVRVSPISLRAGGEVSRPQPKRLSGDESASGEKAIVKSSCSPNAVTAINSKPTHSAFVTVPRTAQAGLTPPIFPPTSSPLKRPSESKKGNVQLFAFEYDSEKKDEESTSRPKRKLKATVRFDPDMAETQTSGCRTGSGFACPRCDFICDYSSKLCSGCQLECYYEAGIGVVALKDRDSVSSSQPIAPLTKRPRTHISRSEVVLCNCTYCDRRHFSIQGIYAHHGRAHGQTAGKKLDWAKVTFTCPFCKSNELFSLVQVEKHVRDHHPGCELLTPNTDKPSRDRNRSRIKVASPTPPSLQALRVTRMRHQGVSSESLHRDESPDTVPKWTKLDHRSLLPDCKKDYPREIPNIVDLIEEQCRAQEGVIATARDQRLKICKVEAEMEAKLLDDDRLAYIRGIRERTRLADGERIEKERFTESQKLMLMQYEYENRNRKRTRDEIEADKLCSKPVVFSSTKGRHLPSEKATCKYDQCELCKDDSSYLQSVMLDTEMASMKRDDPSSQSLLPEATVLKPSFHAIAKSYFTEAEEILDGAEGAKSRRDVATSKRLRAEEDKLFKMRSDQRSLEFINKYNEGLIRNAWK